MEASLCVRVYFATKEICDDVKEFLDEETRPVFGDGLSKKKNKLFEVLEFSENPESIKLQEDNSLYVTWFVGFEETIEEILNDLLKCGAKALFALVDADDYCEFYKLKSKRMILVRDVEKSALTDIEIDLSSEKLLEKEFDLLL